MLRQPHQVADWSGGRQGRVACHEVSQGNLATRHGSLAIASLRPGAGSAWPSVFGKGVVNRQLLHPLAVVHVFTEEAGAARFQRGGHNE